MPSPHILPLLLLLLLLAALLATTHSPTHASPTTGLYPLGGEHNPFYCRGILRNMLWCDKDPMHWSWPLKPDLPSGECASDRFWRRPDGSPGWCQEEGPEYPEEEVGARAVRVERLWLLLLL
jgi:hypothetical protein